MLDGFDEARNDGDELGTFEGYEDKTTVGTLLDSSLGNDDGIDECMVDGFSDGIYVGYNEGIVDG